MNMYNTEFHSKNLAAAISATQKPSPEEIVQTALQHGFQFHIGQHGLRTDFPEGRQPHHVHDALGTLTAKQIRDVLVAGDEAF